MALLAWTEVWKGNFSRLNIFSRLNMRKYHLNLDGTVVETKQTQEVGFKSLDFSLWLQQPNGSAKKTP